MFNRKSILIVDDHPIFREGLRQIIENDPEFLVCGEAEDAWQAMAAVENGNPEIVVVDISLHGVDGIELTKRLLSRFPHLLVLVVSMYEEKMYAERALHAGAKGYVRKTEGRDQIRQALHKVARGEIFLSEATADVILEKQRGGSTHKIQNPLESLSDRELEVFQYIGRGMKPKQIAECLNLSVRTVESYSGNIQTKLNLNSANELLQYAIEWRTKNSDS